MKLATFTEEIKALNWRAVDTWPMHIRKIAILVVGFVAWLLLFVLFNLHQYSALSTAKQMEDTLKQNLANQIPLVLTQKKEQLQLAQIKQMIQQKSDQLADAAQLSVALDEITKAATDNQSNLLLLKPNDAVKDDIYMKIPIDIDLAGTYANIASFLNQLAHLPYYLYYSSMALAPPDHSKKNTTETLAPDALRLQMTIDLYYLAPTPTSSGANGA